MRKISIIGLIIIVFMVKELAWVYLVPPREAPDELAHYSYIETIAHEHVLPTLGQTLFSKRVELVGATSRQAEEAGSYIDTLNYQPGSQINWIAQHPPLYYLTLLPAYSLLPHKNVIFCIMVLRLMSVLMGAVTLWFVSKTVKEMLPCDRIMPALITCAIAFLPTFSYISATINNDNLVMMLSMVLIYLLVARLSPQNEVSETQKNHTIRWELQTGIVLALLALTKTTALPLFLVVLFLQIFDFFRAGCSAKRKSVAVSTAIIFGIPLIVAGWWYFRNLMMFGAFFPQLADAIAVNPKILNLYPGLAAIFPELAPGASAKLSLVDFFVRKNFFLEYFKNFWGAFGSFFIQLTSWQYIGIFAFTVIGAAGQIKHIHKKTMPNPLKKMHGFMHSGQGILFLVFVILLASLTWKIYEISSLRGFLSAMQGRYFLAAAPALFYMLMRGWEHLTGEKWFSKAAKIMMVLFIINDAAALIYVIIPNFY
jgi:hypothetical protein